MKNLILILTGIFLLQIFSNAQDELKLTSPNGGEVLYAGNKSTISWEGISNLDTILIEFSSDNGNSWIEITDDANDLNYEWNVPPVSGNNNLIRIKKLIKDNSVKEGDIEWQTSVADSRSGLMVRSIKQTSDGGFVVAGSKEYVAQIDFGDDWDYWILKLDSIGKVEWEKTYGGNKLDFAYDIEQTKDGGFIVAGRASSEDGDITNPNGNYDGWIIRLDEAGDLLWQKSFGGTKSDNINDIVQTNDGGFIFGGYLHSEVGYVDNIQVETDYWVLKTDSLGNVEWEKTYGGSLGEGVSSLIQTSDNHYILAGGSSSEGGNMSSPKGKYDFWVLKLDSQGELIWEKSYGGSENESPAEVLETLDGGYIIAGHTYSDDKDVSYSNGDSDYWILKLNKEGSKEWERTYGYSSRDRATSIDKTKDGGIIVGGYGSIIEGSNYPKNSYDYWIIKLSSVGKLEWKKSYGGSKSDQANSVIQTNDGGYVIAGETRSTDGDLVDPGTDQVYAWILKTEGEEIKQSDISDATFSIILPEPKFQTTIDFGKVETGKSKDSTVSAVICNESEAPLNVSYLFKLSGDRKDFNINDDDKYFSLGQGECRDFEFTFAPKGIGIRNVGILVSTSIGDFKDAIVLKGEGVDDATSVIEEDYYISTSNEVTLAPPTPNITSSQTEISFETIESGHTRLEIYDMMGNKVSTIINGNIAAGKREMTLDLSIFPSGRYYIKLTTPTAIKTQPIQIVR